MKNHENKVKITLKYDDGREKVTLYVDAEEMEICLENDYQHRLSVASPEERAAVRKYTPAEFADRLNKDSYNNWHTENRRTVAHIKNPCAEEGDDSFINPIDMIPDNTTAEEIEEWAELDAMRQKLYGNLPKAQADLLWDIAVNEVPIPVIAAREGVTVPAIYSRLETVRKKAKKLFENP